MEVVNGGAPEKGDPEKGASGAAGGCGEKRVSGLPQENDRRRPEGRGGTYHGAHVGRILERDAENAS